MEQQLSLRKWRDKDLDRVVALANNPRIAQYLDDGFPHPYSEADGRAFIQKVREADDYHLFRAICLDDLFIGSIGLHPKSGIQRHVLEIGYWLGEPFWGRGIMSWAIREMCALGFAQEGVKRITAGIMAHNLGSQKALEKAGFKQEARLEKGYCKYGEYYDNVVYAILHPDWR